MRIDNTFNGDSGAAPYRPYPAAPEAITENLVYEQQAIQLRCSDPESQRCNLVQ